MSLRLSNDTVEAKYHNGKWIWNDKTNKIEFISLKSEKTLPDYAVQAPKIKFGIQFKDYMDQYEEIIFRNKFVRPEHSKDSDVITIQDIKNLVFFTTPDKNLVNIFIEFFYQETIDQFLNDLIIYFEHFIKTVEFLLIRRDEIKGDNGKIRNMDSIKVERILAEHLCQHRLILAREYSKITLGKGDMKRFHHLYNKQKRSMTERDSKLFEMFLSFCTRVVWISMFRKSYNIIDFEINRLFRSGHFNVAEKQLPNCINFTKSEQQILYGPNDIRVNYRNQKSPLILEILRIKPKNTEVLIIGEHIYRGRDPRLNDLQLEYATPESQLSFASIQHGILGHPKSLYNTLLNLDLNAVRNDHYTTNYDPYNLVTPTFIKIPKISETEKRYEKISPLYRIINKKNEPEINKRQKKLFKDRQEIIKSFGTIKLEDLSYFSKCEKMLNQN